MQQESDWSQKQCTALLGWSTLSQDVWQNLVKQSQTAVLSHDCRDGIPVVPFPQAGKSTYLLHLHQYILNDSISAQKKFILLNYSFIFLVYSLIFLQKTITMWAGNVINSEQTSLMPKFTSMATILNCHFHPHTLPSRNLFNYYLPVPLWPPKWMFPKRFSQCYMHIPAASACI